MLPNGVHVYKRNIYRHKQASQGKVGEFGFPCCLKSEKLPLDPELSWEIVFNIGQYFRKKWSVF